MNHRCGLFHTFEGISVQLKKDRFSVNSGSLFTPHHLSLIFSHSPPKKVGTSIDLLIRHHQKLDVDISIDCATVCYTRARESSERLIN